MAGEYVVIALVGPTASGKSALADEMAKRIDAEVVSADSMQVYRGMDIGTAKTPVAERSVPYHCLDLVDPGQPYSVALYQAEARKAIDSCLKRGVVPLVCGGTGLYIRAALDDFSFPAGEQQDNPVRMKYESFLSEKGADALHLLLQEADPESAALIHPNNSRRVIRALEMLEEGASYASQHEGFSSFESFYPSFYIGLTAELPVLYQRIDRRVDEMLSQGLEDEIKGLIAQGFEKGLTAPQAIGYKEFVACLRGELGRDEAIEAVKKATRNYAKRQRTWFKRDKRINWIELVDGKGQMKDLEAICEEALQLLDENGLAHGA